MEGPAFAKHENFVTNSFRLTISSPDELTKNVARAVDVGSADGWHDRAAKASLPVNTGNTGLFVFRRHI